MPRFFRLSFWFSIFAFALLAGAGFVRAEDRPGRGRITGVVTDQATGQPLLGVEVSVLDQPYRASSDEHGRFTVEDIPVGEHVVEFRLAKYDIARVPGVVVKEGEPASVEGAMGVSSEVQLMDELTVSTEAARKGSRNAALEERLNVNVAMDLLSKEEIAKFVATDVSDVIIRMPGVNLASKGSFAVIRGLSERYNSTTLNGIVLPSSDPERQSVELDQFPTRLLDGLAVFKTFSPELPGQTSGGGVDVRTVDFPQDRVLSLTVGLAVDEGRLHHDDYLTYATRGHADGWAKGTRDRVSPAEFDTGGLTEKVPMTAERKTMPFGKKFGFYYGRTFPLGGESRLGVSFGLAYDSSYSNERGRVTNFDGLTNVRTKDGSLSYANGTAGTDGKPLPFDRYDYLRSREKVQLGVLATVGFQLNAANRFRIVAFSTQSGTDTAQFDDNFLVLDTAHGVPLTPQAGTLVPGVSAADTAERFRYRLTYRERNLSSLAVSGTHRFRSLNDAELQWSLVRNTAFQDEPDRRKFTYVRPYNESQFEIRGGNETIDGSVTRYWRKTDEAQRLGQTTLKLPFRILRFDVTAEAGAAISRTDRTFREYPSESGSLRDPLILEDPIQAVDYLTKFEVEDPVSVELQRKLDAGFLRLELRPRDWLTVAGGMRWERAALTSTGFGVIPGSGGASSAIYYFVAGDNRHRYFWQIPWDSAVDSPKNRELATANIRQADPLPAASVSIRLATNTNLRLAYSHTVARPSIREVSPYLSLGDDDRYLLGNPFLHFSAVRNWDARFERLFGDGELIALSLFRKLVHDPLERYQISSPIGGGIRPDVYMHNPHTAEVRGFEFEFRKNLRFLGDWAEPFSVGGNFTRISASVGMNEWLQDNGDTRPEKIGLLAQDRRLFDQPGWLANGDVTWESKGWGTALTIAAVATDSVLNTVTGASTPDIYRAGSVRWDATLRQKLGRRLSLKLSAKNLNDPIKREWRDPRFVSGLIDREWKDGRSYSLTATYDF